MLDSFSFQYRPRPDFEIRERFGPSILELGGKCMRAWGLRYLIGFDSLDPTWYDIREHTYDSGARMWRTPYRGDNPACLSALDWPSRKRSTALGTEAHAIAEAFYSGASDTAMRTVGAGYQTWAEAWASFPGQVAQAWLDVMPRPDECDEVFTELGVAVWEGEGLGEDVEIEDPVVIEGTTDLLLDVKGAGWLAGDFKTTRDWRYQKSAETLYTDRQGVIYPLAAMRRLGLDAIPGRWAYSITDPKRRREARATDFVQTRENAEALARGYFAEARELRRHLRLVADMTAAGKPDVTGRLNYVQALPANPDHCDAYGGCPHSWERGGACMARRSLGSRIACAGASAGVKSPATPDVSLERLLQASLKEGTNTMTMSPWKMAAERAKAQAAAAAAQAPALDPQPTAPAPVTVAEQAAAIVDAACEIADAVNAADETTAVATPAPKRRGRPPGSKNRPEPATVAVGLTTSQVRELADGGEPAGLTTQQANALRPLATALANSPPVDALVAAPSLLDPEQAEEINKRESGSFPVAAPGPAKTPAPTAFDKWSGDPDGSVELRDLAAAALALGCEIVVRFPGAKAG